MLGGGPLFSAEVTLVTVPLPATAKLLVELLLRDIQRGVFGPVTSGGVV